MNQENGGFRITFNTITSFIVMVAFFVLLFFIARGVFQILAFLAPVLIIAAILINYRTVTGFLKFLWNLVNRRPLMGILAIILTVLGFPVVSGILFGKSLLDRRMRQFIEAQEPREEFTEYEEVFDENESLELPPLEKPRQEPPNRYTDYLDED